MTQIFIATEADEGAGHIAPWHDFVQQASQQGHHVHMAAPNVGQLNQLIGRALAIDIWQAPCLRRSTNFDELAPRSWPELLVSLDYGNTGQLGAVVQAWLSILKCVQPSVVLADYAPALLLAAKILDIPVIEVGGGFCVPPLSSVQCFPGLEMHDLGVAQKAARALVQAFNGALHDCGSRHRLSSLADFSSWSSLRVVISPPELDHYGEGRKDISYLGLFGIGLSPSKAEAQASQVLHKRPAVVGYLKPDTPGLSPLIDQLVAADINACLFVPDANFSVERGSVKVVNRPIDLPQAFLQADIYLSNGGLHGVGQALHFGCWPVIVPMQAEQVAMVRNLVRRGWGGLWLPGSSLTPHQLRQRVFFAQRRPPVLRNPVELPEKAMLSLVEQLTKKTSAKD